MSNINVTFAKQFVFSIADLSATVAYANSLKTTNGFNFIVIGYGSGDFNAEFGQFVLPQLIYNFTSDYTPLKEQLYKDMCL